LRRGSGALSVSSAANARLKIIAGCAHVPQLQVPEIFPDAILDFLPEISAASLRPTASVLIKSEPKL
jgi:hypothetical protein